MSMLKGTNLRAPAASMTLGGTEYRLKFDMNCFRIAEDVYEEQYGKDVNFAEIALKLTKGKLSAIMAVYYAAIVSGGADLAWADFAATFKLTDVPGVRDRLTDMLSDALPEADGEKKGPFGPADERESGPSSPGTGSGTGL